MRKQQRPETVRVRVGDLHIDDAGYQRSPDPAWVKTLIGRFVRVADIPFPEISVRSDGTLWVMDGGHRVTAIRDKWGPDTVVTCHAHYDLAYEQEARMFAALNQDLKLRAFSTFHALVLSGDEHAIAIEKTLLDFGLTYGPATTDSTVGAVGALQQVYDRGVLAETLRTLISAWAFSKETWDGHLLKGMGLFIQRYPDADLSSLAGKLGKGGSASTFLGASKDYSKVLKLGVPRAVGFNLHRVYNQRRSARGSLPPWQ